MTNCGACGALLSVESIRHHDCERFRARQRLPRFFGDGHQARVEALTTRAPEDFAGVVSELPKVVALRLREAIIEALD
jgi:hypothetical protein